MKTLLRLTTIYIASLLSVYGLGLVPAAQEGFDEAFRSVREHRLPSSELIKDPQNQEWLRDLRSGALDEGGGFGGILFLNLGDPEVLKKHLELYHANNWAVVGTLARTIQPKIIAAIAEDFYREEPVTTIYRDDVGDFYPSMRACRITQEIIKNSPVFSDKLKQWVKDDQNPRGLREEVVGRLRRDGMRVWCTENKALFVAERYSEVKPPSTWKQDETPVAGSGQSATRTSGGGAPMPKAGPSPILTEPTKSQPASTLPWTVGIAFIVALIGVAVMMRRKA